MKKSVPAPPGFHWMKKGDGKYKLMKHAPKKFKKHTSIIAGHDNIWVAGALIEIMNNKKFKAENEINLLMSNQCSSWILDIA